MQYKDETEKEIMALRAAMFFNVMVSTPQELDEETDTDYFDLMAFVMGVDKEEAKEAHSESILRGLAYFKDPNDPQKS